MTINDRINQWIRPKVREISAYHVADASGLIKLDAMENPYHWPADMVSEWTDRLASAELNRYPDPAARALSERIREVMGVPDEMGLMLGNGSDEIIQILALALGGQGHTVLAPEPSFVMYRMIAAFSGLNYVGVPLNADFSLDIEAMLSAIHDHNPAVIYLAYPNNPTGNLFAGEQIEAIIKAANGVVVIDEAYHAFAGNSYMSRLGDYDNVLVMRTVSKLGLAGLRLGFMAGPKAWIAEFDKVRLPYNINVLTQLSADFALQREHIFEEQTATIRAERHTLFEALEAIDGIQPFPSAANFILFRAPAGRATEIFNRIKEKGVLIKNMGASEGPLADCLRVTVGTPEENAAFLEALKASM